MSFVNITLYLMDAATITPVVVAPFVKGVFNLCQHLEISYSKNANKHFITGVYITINDSYR